MAKTKRRPHQKRQRRPATKRQRTRRRSSGGTSAPRTPKQIIAEAARKEGVPFWVLFGVWGVESGYSRNPGVSSAGAEGPFQFMPATAAGFGIDPNNFHQAAFAAAKYLRQMRNEYGSWNAALEGYNAGPGNIGKGIGYTKETIRVKAAEKGVTPRNSQQQSQSVLAGVLGTPFGPDVGPDLWPGPDGIPSLPGGGGGGDLLGSTPLGPFIDAADATTRVFSLLADPQFWIRVAQAIGGLILIYMALKSLTGRDVPGVSAAKNAAKAAAFKRLPPRQRVKGS